MTPPAETVSIPVERLKRSTRAECVTNGEHVPVGLLPCRSKEACAQFGVCPDQYISIQLPIV